MEIYQFILQHLNYGTIWFLMLLESTVIPVPSEFVVPPAAYFAATGHLNVWLVIISATLGADCGATINYIAGRYLGRPIIYKFANSRLGKLCFLSVQKIQKSENYFNAHGNVATFSGRFIPVIRHLISIPAGMARMSFSKFLFFTTLGAGLWHCVLAAMGWYMQLIVTEEQLYESLSKFGNYLKFAILGILAAAILFVIVRHYLKKKS